MNVRQIENVLDLLEHFSNVREPQNLAQISAHFGWPKSSTFNVLRTLFARGFLYEPTPRAGYYPTPKWLSLLEQITNTKFFPEELKACVNEICIETGESVVLGAPS